MHAHAHILLQLLFSKMASNSSQNKAVLVCCGERKKVLNIAKKKSTTDLEFLKEKFYREFGLKSCHVSFQRFDEEWDEYAELGEDSIIHNKDKLTAIVEAASSFEGKVSYS